MSNFTTIGSFNILNDERAVQGLHPYQIDRIEDIAKQISSHRPLHCSRFIMYVCEASSPEHLARIADMSDLTMGETHEYSASLDGWSETKGFLMDHKTAQKASITLLGDEGRETALKLVVDDLEIFGLHARHRPWEELHRLKMMQLIAQSPQAEGIDRLVVGDYNALPWWPSRALLSLSGYTFIHSKDKPMFPEPQYKGITTPRRLPDIPIDALYHRGSNYTIKDRGWNFTGVSDHPIVWADFQRTSTGQ